MEETQIDPGCSSEQLLVQKFLFLNPSVSGNTFFFFQFLKYLWFDWAVEELECAWNKPLSGNGGPILLPWKPMLKHHIMLSFSQQTWVKSKIWSQKITTSIKWIQVFWDKCSMGLFQNKMSNGTEKMCLPSIQ